MFTLNLINNFFVAHVGAIAAYSFVSIMALFALVVRGKEPAPALSVVVAGNALLVLAALAAQTAAVVVLCVPWQRINGLYVAAVVGGVVVLIAAVRGLGVMADQALKDRVGGLW